jgi:WD40 repeat protein
MITIAAALTSMAQEEGSPKLVIQRGHTSAINDVSYSPDGRFIATAGKEGVVKLWDARELKLLDNLEGHTGEVETVKFSPDGRLLASCGGQELKIWEVQTGRLVRDLRQEDTAVFPVSFSPDGSLLASAGKYGERDTINLWDVRRGILIKRFGEETGRRENNVSVVTLGFALGGKVLVSGGHKKIYVWSVPEGKLLRSFDAPDGISPLVVLPDGRSFVTGGSNESTPQHKTTAILWDTEGRALRTLVEVPSSLGMITDIAFSPDSKTFVVGYWEDTSEEVPRLEVRDSDSGRLIRAIQTEISRGVNALEFSPDGKKIVTSSGCPWYNSGLYSASVWEVSSGKLLDWTYGSTDEGTALAVSRDGRMLARNGEQNIQLLDAERGELIRILPNQIEEEEVTAMAFSPDGKRLASVSPEAGGRIWSTSDGSLIKTVGAKSDELTSVVYSPDGGLIAIGGGSNVVQLIDAHSGETLKRLSVPRLHASSPKASFQRAGFAPVQHANFYLNWLAFSPDGRMLAVGGDTTPPHAYYFESACNGRPGPTDFMPASYGPRADDYSDLTVWDVRRGTLIRSFGEGYPNVSSVVFRPDGETLIAGYGDGLIKVWSVSSEAPLYTREEVSSLEALALSPDGKLLASAGADGVIRLRSATDTSLIRELRGHINRINSVAFTRDGKDLVSVGHDATTKFWSTDEGKLLVTFMSYSRNAKSTEWVSFTPDGYYYASKDAGTVVKWRSGGALYDEPRYRQQYNRPDLIAARLAESTSSPSITGTVVSSAGAAKVGLSPEAEKSLWAHLPAKQFYALVIGNNDYRYIGPLRTAVNDAAAVEKVLREEYGFKTKLLRDADRA